MNMLEAIRATGLTHSVKFYQASTSELYGKVQHSNSQGYSSLNSAKAHLPRSFSSTLSAFNDVLCGPGACNSPG